MPSLALSTSLRSVPQNSGVAAYSPSLLLDMTSGNQTLDPRITFSRASNATVTGPDGLIEYAPHNLLTYSEQFDNSVWLKANTSVVANTVIAPNGTLTGDLHLPTTTAAEHVVSQPFSFTSETTYSFSIYLKEAGYTQCRIRFQLVAFGATQSVDVDLIAGTAIAVAGTPIATITNVGNGWYRVTSTVTATTTATAAISIFPKIGGSTTAAGDGTSGIFIWGAQLNVGALQPYYTTSVKNLLGYTQEFDNAAWTKTRSSITANATTDPQGFMTADKLVEDTTATNSHLFSATITSTTGVNTFSVFAKAAERPRLQLRFAGGSDVRGAAFNLLTGTVEAETLSATTQANNPSITDVGNGWYRCSIDSAGTGDTTVQGYLDNGTSHSYTGDGTSGIFIWGAQLSDSASLDPYVYNPVAAPAAAAYYGPRFDYDPVTLAPKGLLIEESRTNLLLQSEDFTTSWSVGGQNATITSNTTTAPNGTTTADTLTDDATNGIHRVLQTVTTSNTLQMVYSVFAKYSTMQFISISASTGTTTWAGAKFDIQNGVLGSTSQQGTGFTANSSSITDVGNGWYRCVLVYTPGASGSTLMLVSGATDGTTFTTGQRGSEVYTGTGSAVFLWGAQMETGAFPTSYIPTTTAAATRAADVATMIGANFSNWYNADEGTLFADASPQVSNAGGSVLFEVNDATASNRIGVAKLVTTGNASMAVLVGGATQVSTNNGAWTSSGKLAGAYAVNDFASVLNGSAASTDTSGTLPVVTQATIGARGDGAARLNGTIKRLAYFPRRLSDAELQGITS